MKRPVTLKKVERFLEVTGWGPTRFGRAVGNDPWLVRDMRAGRAITSELSDTIATFIEKYVESERARVRKLSALAR